MQTNWIWGIREKMISRILTRKELSRIRKTAREVDLGEEQDHNFGEKV